MQVIADLHGGDPDNIEALEEFREIKDRVIAEVNFLFINCRTSSLFTLRGKLVKHGHML